MSRSVCRVAAMAAALVAIAGPRAEAKSERNTWHGHERIWPSAIRFLRVDQGYDIVDKDQDAGYIVFEFEEDDRRFRGSLELVQARDSEDRPELRLVLTLNGRPSYLEDMVLERLMDKIRAEHGDGAPPPARKKKPKKPDEKPRDGSGKPKQRDTHGKRKSLVQRPARE